jgi:predicted DNA-binding transcriptional regulator AlpA
MTPTATNPELLTKADVCARLSFSARTLESLCRAGAFPTGVRIGRLLYWRVPAIDAWLTRQFGQQDAWRP